MSYTRNYLCEYLIAEPVQAVSIDNFYAVFSKYGLPSGVIFPTYGLAEHTVFVSSNGKQRLVVNKTLIELSRQVELVAYEEANENSMMLMGCGKPSDCVGIVVKVLF